MTTVAWDGQSLAADRRASGGLSVGKIFRMPDGSYIAGAGIYDQIVEIAAWMTGGSKADERPALPDDGGGSSLLWITKEGRAYWLTWPYLRPVEFNEPYASVGSGSDFALGALRHGATAKQAVQIASHFDPSTGKGIDVVQVVKPAKRK
jgi:20S proteasome alpha/beta subunit